MKIKQLHPWNVTPEEAIALQKSLRKRLKIRNDFGDVRWVAECDMSLDPIRNEGYAGVLVYTWPDLELVEKQSAALPLTFPYVPGLLLDKPSVGCAKSLLYGRHEEPGPEKGGVAWLHAKTGEVIGAALRTKPRCKPMIISPGHRIDLKTSLDFVRRCLNGYRLPRPTREADAFVATIKRSQSLSEGA